MKEILEMNVKISLVSRFHVMIILQFALEKVLAFVKMFVNVLMDSLMRCANTTCALELQQTKHHKSALERDLANL